MNLDLTIPYNTVITLVGPTMCGKSTFGHALSESLCELGRKNAVLSSDNYRRTLLGSFAHRHSPEMLAVSRQAFELLFAQLRAHTSYPANTDVIVVDTTGFDDRFRKEVNEVAVAAGYNTMCVSFEYKDKKLYTAGCQTAQEKSAVERSVDRFLRKVLPDLRAKDYNSRVRIRERIKDIDVSLPAARYGEVITTGQGKAYVVGDVHECVDELGQLLSEFVPESGDGFVVLVGDYLDKGGDTFKTLKMVRAAQQEGAIVVIGNHESYVYRRLFENLDPNPELEAEYFSSIQALQTDETYRDLFRSIFECSVPYFQYSPPNCRGLIVTHAPCHTKYLGKDTAAAHRAQRNFYFKERGIDAMRKELEFIYKEADQSHPFHVFGHVAHSSDQVLYKNKVFLDTGAVHGGRLSMFEYDPDTDRFEIRSVQCRRRESQAEFASLPDLVTPPARKFDIHDYSLSEHDERLLRNVVKNDVKYISGTMPPAPSTDLDLETLDAALDYFQKKGVASVALQPKYMGSRCQLYLFKDAEKESFAVSRNGWRIRHVEGLDELLAKWVSRAFANSDADSMILDGELLPWSALGKGLIEDHFLAYQELVRCELETLASDMEFAKLDITQKFDVQKKYEHLSKFEQTLALYSANTSLEFKPFNILSIDGQPPSAEHSAAALFATFNDDDVCTGRVDLESHRKVMHDFYRMLTVERGMEGVVVKPLHTDGSAETGVVPYMKVRNPEYLRLVYGYDYQDRYATLVRQKNISHKVRTAIKEHQLASEMLIASDDKRKELAVKMIAEINKEKEFDPRL